MTESNATKSGDRVSYHVLENQIEADDRVSYHVLENQKNDLLADDADADATPTPSRLATLNVSGSGASTGTGASKRPDGYAPVPVGQAGTCDRVLECLEPGNSITSRGRVTVSSSASASASPDQAGADASSRLSSADRVRYRAGSGVHFASSTE